MVRFGMELMAKILEYVRQGRYPCLFHLATGAYCPGCGGTRAAVALLHGQLLLSLRYHPLIPYMALALPALLAYRIYCRRKGQRPRAAVGMTVLYAGIAITVLNFLVKNYYLLVRHVDLLG